MLDEWNTYDEEYGRSTNPFDDDDTGSAPAQGGGQKSGASGASGAASGAGKSAAAEVRPMFNVEKLEWWPTADQGPVVSMDVGNNVLLIGTANNFVIRWNVDTDHLDEILITTKKDERISKVFIDPSGMHSLVSMANGVNYYLGARRDKPVLLSKLKGPVVVESAGWYTSSADARSGPGSTRCTVMLGTTRGLLFDLVVEDGKEKSCKKLFDLTDSGADASASVVISAAHVEEFPASAPHHPGAPHPRFFVMIATPMRYYEFVGGPTLEAVFAKQGPNLAFVELPGSLGYSELRFSTPKSALAASLHPGSTAAAAAAATAAAAGSAGAAAGDRAKTSSCFAWLTAAGLFQGSLRFGVQSNPGDRVVCDGNLVEYPVYPDVDLMQQLEAQGAGVGSLDRSPRLSPLSMILTDVHYLLLFKNRLIAINQLSKEIVFDCMLPRKDMGTPRGLCYDPRQDTVWLYTDRHVFEVEVTDETRDVWSIYLAQGNFSLAERAARTPAQRDCVLNQQADSLFQAGKYAEAAAAYAGTNHSFEEVTLKFVGSRAQAMLHTPNTPAAAAAAAAAATAGADASGPSSGSNGPLVPLPFASSPLATPAAARNALKTYLRSKLKLIDNKDLTQLTMVCVWLVEIYLDTINAYSDPAADFDTAASSSSSSSSAAGGRGSAGVASVAAVSIHTPSSASAERDRLLALQRSEQRAAAVEEFREFIDEYSDCLPRDATLDLIGSHGLVSEMLYYATAVNDSAFVLDYYVQHGRFAEAISLLGKHSATADRPDVAECFYRFVPSLIVPKPEETVDVLIKTPALDVLQLIPAFLRAGLTVYEDGTVAIQPGSALAGPDASATAGAVGGPPGSTVAALSSVSRALAAQRVSSVSGATGGSGGVPSSALARATEAKLAKLGAAAIVSAGSSATAAANLRSRADAAGRPVVRAPSAAAVAAAAAAEEPPTIHSQQVCRYLRHVISTGAAAAPVLHNLYLVLLARLRSETPLLDFVCTSFENGAQPGFDVNFALRASRSASPPKLRTCVELLRRQHLYRDAVQLALQVDDELAKEVLLAARPTLAAKPELQRQLWLAFAQKLIRSNRRAKAVLDVLSSVDCGLSLEDILPSFPDFVTIGEFKGEILDALNAYTDEIGALKDEMNVLTAAATQIRFDLQRLQHRSGVVRVRQRCDICSQPATLRGFLLFPCSHVFHENCARNAAAEYLCAGHGHGAGAGAVSNSNNGGVAMSERKFSAYKTLFEDVTEDSPLMGLKAAFDARALSADQDALLCDEFTQSQCVLCGDVMIHSVAQPFVDAEREADEISSWVI